ncbi:MAG: tol-pal system protein YbgF [Deltaproteobacteria bacterium]|nr:tol-pal system protein YbgF [Deltaproteobacteria bacterium]
MKISHVVPFGFLACLAGCATQGSMDNVRTDIGTLKARLFSVEKEMGSIRDDSKGILSAMEKGLKSDVAAVRKLSADIQATIDGTKSEMQALNGKLDDMQSALKKPADDLSRYREDADKRIIILEDRILKQQKVLEDVNGKIAELLLAKEKAAAAAAAAPVAPDALYPQAMDTFKAGDMPAAREQFTKFLEQNPQHDLAANAHYWIGETYTGEKNYESAILSYQEVIKNYPAKDKVTAAMLKQAMAFNAINDTKSAKYVLKKLTEGFPKSEEAKKAKDLLKEIK